MGYNEIGMDHFSLKTDSLYKATQENTLHRNFMGYTANKTLLMVGLGMSSISDSWYGFAQNAKDIKEYTALVNEGILPIFKGHLLSKEDLSIRQHILNIMCSFKTTWNKEESYIKSLAESLALLEEMQNDGLVDINEDGLSIPSNARPFIRNICMAFDKHLIHAKPQTKLFSMTI